MTKQTCDLTPQALAFVLCLLLDRDPATIDDQWTQARAQIDEAAVDFDPAQRAEFYEAAVRFLDPDHRYGPYAGLGTPMTTELFIYEINRVDDYSRTHPEERLALYLAMCLLTMYDSLTEQDRVIAMHVADMYRARQLGADDFPGFDYVAHLHATGQDTTQVEQVLDKAAKIDGKRASWRTTEMRTAPTEKKVV